MSRQCFPCSFICSHLFIEMSPYTVCPSVCLSIRPGPSVRPSIYLSVRPSVRPSIRPSVPSYVRPSIRMSVRPSVRMPVRPSVSSYVRPSSVRPTTNLMEAMKASRPLIELHNALPEVDDLVSRVITAIASPFPAEIPRCDYVFVNTSPSDL